MSAPTLRLVKETRVFLRRNFGLCAPVWQKGSDPIQQLFVDKLRDYKNKSSGGKLVDPTPEEQKDLQADLKKIANQFGGAGEDMSSFPKLVFNEPKLDPIDSETKQ